MPSPTRALQVQLEGRWEHLEQAQERYGALTRQLGSLRWRRLLRSEPGLLSAVKEQEPGLDEVLAYVERRAQAERWPEDHPGPAMLRALRSQRARLEALGRKRLAQWGLRGGASFAEVLSGLEAQVLSPVPRLPGESEPVLAEGHAWLSGSRLWLTPERLVWYPWWGEPEQILLSTLDVGSLSLLPGGLGVRLEGEKQLTLAGVPWGRALAALLERYSQKQRASGPPVREVISHTASLDVLGSGREADVRWGMAVLRPGYLAFLPERRPSLRDRLAHFVGGAGSRVREERWRLEAVVEHLRQLPEAEFDRCVEELVRARGGVRWPSRELGRAGSRVGQGPRLMFRGRSVVGLTESPLEPIERFFQQHWPQALKGAERSVWRRHSGFLLGFGIGLACWAVALALGPPFDGVPGYLVAQVPFVLAFMRYARTQGHSPLHGLLALLSCTGWALLFLYTDKSGPNR